MWLQWIIVLLSFFCFSSLARRPPQSVFHMRQVTRPNDNDNGSPYIKDLKSPLVEFTLAKHFQDNMVLQRAPKRARIYGFSPDIGSRVMVQMTLTSDKKFYYSTLVVKGPEPGIGTWVVTLDPMDVTEPVTFKFVTEAKTLTLKNVLFGDVWLCSGQSNMQFTVSQMFQGDQEALDAHNYPNIRLFTAAKDQSNTPLYDLKSVDESWTAPSAGKVSNGPWTYFSSVCWLFGKNIYQTLGYPIGLIATDWGGTPVEAWSSPDVLNQCFTKKNLKAKSKRVNVTKTNGPQENSCLWNAMIHPFLGLTIYGAIWYQGENDALDPGHMNNYNCTFPTMIDDWRLKFSTSSDQETNKFFPFGFVQLSANRPGDVDVGFPDIRWHQTADFGFVPNTRMPNTFMAVAMDLPDFNSTYGSIHPRDKEDVGNRLALSGLAVAYDRDKIYQGPFPWDILLDQTNSIVLDYRSQYILRIKSLKGFEVSCTSDSGWYPAPIAFHNDTTITLNNSVCSENLPYAVRYAWRESPCAFKRCAVYSLLSDLPAAPFLHYFKSRKDRITV